MLPITRPGKLFQRYSGIRGILLEPHGAIAWRGMNEYLRQNEIPENNDKLFISLETAHPAKFPEELRRILNTEPSLPESLKGIEAKSENYKTWIIIMICSGSLSSIIFKYV